MKKNFKLFSTIASLCLAVALMAFGVWAAAANITAKVSGTISFTSTDIKGYWTAVAEITSGGTFKGETGEAQTKKTYENTEKSEAFVQTLPEVVVNTTDDNTQVIIKITATFHNTADTVTAKLTGSKVDPTVNDCTLDITGGDLSTAEANNTGDVVYTLTFKANNTYTSANASYELNFAAARA